METLKLNILINNILDNKLALGCSNIDKYFKEAKTFAENIQYNDNVKEGNA